MLWASLDARLKAWSLWRLAWKRLGPHGHAAAAQHVLASEKKMKKSKALRLRVHAPSPAQQTRVTRASKAFTSRLQIILHF